MRHSNPSLIAIAHAAFVLTGTVTTLLGPLLPVLAGRWSLSDATAGYLFTAQFGGSMVGVSFSGVLVKRLGFRTALVAGLTVMAAGVAALGLVSWPLALVTVTCYGGGLGITIPSTNLLVAHTARDARAGALNLLNLAWGAGAVAAPPVFAWSAARGQAEMFLFCLAGALATSAATLLFCDEASPHAVDDDRMASSRRVAHWMSGAFVVYGALFFVYVGTENAIAGWVAAFAQRLGASQLGAATPALFWTGLLAGRALAPGLLRRTSESSLVQAGLFVAAAGVGVVLTASNVAAVLIGATVAGAGLSTVFPTTIAQLSRRFGGDSPQAAAAAFMMAGLGGATVPWLVGYWSTATASLRSGLAIPLIGCVTMMVLHAYRARRIG